jgi:cytochrome c2
MNHLYGVMVIGLMAMSVPTSAQTVNATRGERAFRSCAACHSLEPNL